MYTRDEIARDSQMSVSKVDFEENIDDRVKAMLDKMGIYFRCFSRTKNPDSIAKKLNKKKYSQTKKMTDFYGIRVVLYYRDDIDIVVQGILDTFDHVEIVRDENGTTEFKPERLNIVCRFPEELQRAVNSSFFEKYNIDTTFELQIRTVFSEGWHEVEHDMRYKCIESWKGYDEYARILNGIFATLSTCDWSITQLFDNMAYQNYQKKEWENLLRNKFRIRLLDGELSKESRTVLDENHAFAKNVYKYDRRALIDFFYKAKVNIPINADNIIKIINAYSKQDEVLLSKTSSFLLDIVEEERQKIEE